MYIIRNFLTEEEVQDILKDLKGWEEGFTNASKDHKDNSELIVEELATRVASKIRSHPYASTRLFIKSMTLPRFNKYEVGQKYAKHIDAYKQFGVQTDWSYTLMLKAPEEGGQLELEIDGHKYAPELNAGDIVVYFSGNVHQVLPVIKGERIAAIGWIESLITRADQRAILHNIIDVFKDLELDDKQKENVLKLAYSYHNLLRLWSK